MSGEKDETSAPDSSKCPVKSETWRHVLYVGGMVALHAGLGATLASEKSKGCKCPIGEWGKHAVYTGGVVALVAMQWKKSPAIADETKEDKEATTETPTSWYEACPVNETWRHVVYVVATVGAVAIWNARKKYLRLKPRSAASLHLTLFFGGEVLGEIPAHELQLWHGQVSKRLAEAGLALEEDTVDGSVADSSTMISFDTSLYSLSIDRITTFPPRRNNLIVAVLEPSPAWQVLYRDLVALTKDAPYSKGLRDIAGRSHSTWTPHITLGNLLGKRKGSQMNELREHLVSHTSTQPAYGMVIEIEGIAMGGPVPRQLPLTWNFRPCHKNEKTMTANE